MPVRRAYDNIQSVGAGTTISQCARQAGAFRCQGEKRYFPSPDSADKIYQGKHFIDETADEQEFSSFRFEFCTFEKIGLREAKFRYCEFKHCEFLQCYFDDGVQLVLDMKHWNSQRPEEDHITLPMDLEPDIEWRLATLGDDEDAA